MRIWLIELEDPPEACVIFRESDFKKDSEGRNDYFMTRAQSLVELYSRETSSTIPTKPVFWTLIKSQSSNTNFTTSRVRGIVKLRDRLFELRKSCFRGRVPLILSQVDGFTTNVTSWKTVFEFCGTLDLWLYFVHGEGRNSLLNLRILRSIISNIEGGVNPTELVEKHPVAHEYLITLLFMTGVGVNKKK